MSKTNNENEERSDSSDAMIHFRLSYEGRTVDALALGADEGRD